MTANDGGRARRGGNQPAKEDSSEPEKRRLVLSIDHATTLTGPLTEKERRRLTAQLRRLDP